MKRRNFIQNLLIVFAFLLFGLFSVLGQKETFSSLERRPLAKAPAINGKAFWVREMQGDAESYLADHFPFRNQGIALKAQTQKASFAHDNSRVYFGQNDFLIEKHGSLDFDKLKENFSDMQYFAENFAKDIPSSVLLAPTQAEVYRTYLPIGHQESDQGAIFQALLEARTYDALSYLDLMQSLAKEGETRQDLYFRTDHHWTQNGAKIAADLWLAERGYTPFAQTYEKQKLSENFYGTTYAKAPLFTVKGDVIEAYENSDLDALQILDKDGNVLQEGYYNEVALQSTDAYEYFLGKNIDYLEIYNPKLQGSATHLLVFKDSYANAFLSFLTPYFEKITLVDLRYYNESMDALMDRDSYSEILFLYNIVTLSEETATYKLLQN